MQFCVRPAASHFENVHARARVVGMRAVAHQSHVEDAGQQRIRGIQRWHADHDRTESADLVFGRHRASLPWRRRITSAAVVDQREPLTFRIFEEHGQAAVSLDDLAVRDPEFSNRSTHHFSEASPLTRRHVRTMLRVPRPSGGAGQSKNVRSVPGLPLHRRRTGGRR